MYKQRKHVCRMLYFWEYQEAEWELLVTNAAILLTADCE